MTNETNDDAEVPGALDQTTPLHAETPAMRPPARRSRRRWTIAGFVTVVGGAALVAQIAGVTTPAPAPIVVKQIIGRPGPSLAATRVASRTVRLTQGSGIRVTGSVVLTKASKRPSTANVSCALVGSRDGARGWEPVEADQTQTGADPRVRLIKLTSSAPTSTVTFNHVVVAPADDTYRLHYACGVMGSSALVTASKGTISTAPVTA